MKLPRGRSEREAERLALNEDAELKHREALHLLRTTGAYHAFGVEPIAGQVVCHLCGAVVAMREAHNDWHASMGQEWQP